MREGLLQLLAPYRDRHDMKIDDLVHHAADILPQVAGPQGRHKVTAIPDSRTVRYYIHERLVDPPHGSSGGAARLQSHYLPIRRIRETIDNLTDRELERLLESWRSRDAAGAADRSAGLNDAIAGPAVALPSEPGDTVPRDAAPETIDRPVAARAYLESIQQSAPSGYRMETKPIQLAPPEGWTRFELYPGIEVHVREAFQAPQGPSFFSALASRLRVMLENQTRRES